MHALLEKARRAVARAVPVAGQIRGVLRIPGRMQEARDEDAEFRRLMWQMGDARPRALGFSQVQERALIAGELIGNVLLAAVGLFVGYRLWDLVGALVAMFVLGAVGDLAGGRVAQAVFDAWADRRMKDRPGPTDEEAGADGDASRH